MLARQHTQEAIDALVESLNYPHSRVSAATVLLDRGWGKPAQALQITGDGTLQMHMLAALAASEELQALVQQKKPELPAPTIEGEADIEPASE